MTTSGGHGRSTGDRREDGERIVRQMFGREFLDRNLADVAQGDGALAAMARFALEQCYGDVWTRPGLSLRDRSLITLGMLVAAGHPGELANHVLGARGNGVTVEELAELALHSMPYVGFPAAGQAMGVILKAWAEAGEESEQTPSSPADVLRSVFDEPDHTVSAHEHQQWDENVVYHGMGSDGIDRDFHGRAAMLGLLTDTRLVMSAMVDTLVAVHPAGEEFAVAHVRAHRRAARTGETVDGEYTMVVQVKDGLIVRGWDMPSEAYRDFFRKQAAAALQ